MKKLAILLIVLIAGRVDCANAQAGSTPKPTPPPGPLIQKRAPNFSHWNIIAKSLGSQESSDNKKSGNSSGQLKGVEVTKTGPIIHTIITDETGQVWNLWNQAAVHIVISPNGKDVGFAQRPLDPDAVNPFFIDYSNSDFFGFEWISAENYKGEKSYHGRTCLFFDGSGNLGRMYAYIDKDSRLPLALVQDSQVEIYEFQSPPTQMQEIPPNAKQFMEQQAQYIQSMANRPLRPF